MRSVCGRLLGAGAAGVEPGLQRPPRGGRVRQRQDRGLGGKDGCFQVRKAVVYFIGIVDNNDDSKMQYLSIT